MSNDGLWPNSSSVNEMMAINLYIYFQVSKKTFFKLLQHRYFEIKIFSQISLPPWTYPSLMKILRDNGRSCACIWQHYPLFRSSIIIRVSFLSFSFILTFLSRILFFVFLFFFADLYISLYVCTYIYLCIRIYIYISAKMISVLLQLHRVTSWSLLANNKKEL